MTDNITWIFKGKHDELNTSLVWEEYTSNQVSLQEYDYDWSKIYQEEINQIKVSELIFFKDQLVEKKLIKLCEAVLS